VKQRHLLPSSGATRRRACRCLLGWRRWRCP